MQWRILWMTIKQHEEGICDCMCSDLRNIEPNPENSQDLLEWLEEQGYLNPVSIKNTWGSSIEQYMLNWAVTKAKLGVDPPPPLRPLSPEEIK